VGLFSKPKRGYIRWGDLGEVRPRTRLGVFVAAYPLPQAQQDETVAYQGIQHGAEGVAEFVRACQADGGSIWLFDIPMGEAVAHIFAIQVETLERISFTVPGIIVQTLDERVVKLHEVDAARFEHTRHLAEDRLH